jgi:hypothetical protein
LRLRLRERTGARSVLRRLVLGRAEQAGEGEVEVKAEVEEEMSRRTRREG